MFVNNKKVSKIGLLVDIKKDSVRWKKQAIPLTKPTSLYFMFNKPQKVLTTTADPKGRITVMDYIGKTKGRIFPVGRLDYHSEGLLLLTNDGEFSAKILHPKNEIPKTYVVKLNQPIKNSLLQKLLKGVTTAVGRRKALFAKRLYKKNSSGNWVKIIITEGKKRQIRRMFESLGLPIQKLRRTAIGRLNLNKLAKGTYVQLKEQDIKKSLQWPKELQHLKRRRKSTLKKT